MFPARRFALVAVLLIAAPIVAAERAPNIVLILADDIGWSDLGCYGGEIRTPNLNALAKGGLRFTQFYNCARCCPTRASLLTGLYPHQAGVGNMTGDQKLPGYRGRLQPNCVTLAEVLKSAGYRTYMVGKWHLTAKPGPIDRGFDEFYGMLGGFNSCFQENPFYTRLPAGRARRQYPADKFYSTDVFGDYALDFLADARKTGEKPFFLYLAFNAAHFPLQAPKEDIARYKDVYAKGWDSIREQRYARQKKAGLIDREWPLTPRSGYETRSDFFRTGENPAWDALAADRQADLVRRMAIYAAMIDRMDRNIGRVVADLRAHDQLNNTLILFLSDNGACAEWDPFGFDVGSGPKNILHTGADLDRMGGPDTYHSYGSGWANACNAPFRLYKHWAHEGGISTPLIAHWPKKIEGRDKIRNQVGHVIDIMATCVDVAGAKYPERVGANAITPAEGKSLLPTFADRPLDRAFLAWEHEGNKALRAGRWKLVATHDGPWELYDMEADRVELQNQAARHADKVKELASMWQAWAKRTKVLPYPPSRSKKP